MTETQAPSSVFSAFPFFPDPSAPSLLDLRGCAIDVCAAWEVQKDKLKLTSTASRMMRRSDAVRAARALQHYALETQVQTGKPEHPDSIAARLAVVDWIVHQIVRLPKRFKFVGLLSYGRFFWGYLENTPLYRTYFEMRKGNPKETPVTQTVDLSALHTGVAHMGFAYGAPTLGAVLRSRGQQGRGRFNRIGVNEQFWSVLAKNKDALALIHLAKAHDVTQANTDANADPRPLVVNDAAADAIMRLVEPVLAGKNGGPQFIVAQGTLKMRLYLKLARHGSGSKSCGSEPMNWRRTRYGLMHAIEDIAYLSFLPFKDARGADLDWGTFEQLHWHLEPVDPVARTHRKFFKQAWTS